MTQPPDGTLLYSHRGAALRHPVSFRDDLEALGYVLIMLAAGDLPWSETAGTEVPPRRVDDHQRLVVKMKESLLQEGLSAIPGIYLRRALAAYFECLGLATNASNTARYDYAALRELFLCAFRAHAGRRYSGIMGAPADFCAASSDGVLVAGVIPRSLRIVRMILALLVCAAIVLVAYAPGDDIGDVESALRMQLRRLGSVRKELLK